MRIGLYDKPTNGAFSQYKGLYRQNNLVDFCEGKKSILTGLVEWFFSHSEDGMHIKYTEKNMKKTFRLFELLQDEKWNGEIVLFSDKHLMDIPVGAEFMGYDICADSMYYSPLGDGFLTSYLQSDMFFSEMSFDDFQKYISDINEVGLFKSYEIAKKFAKYCNRINSQYPHVVESEENWRPFTILSKKY